MLKRILKIILLVMVIMALLLPSMNIATETNENEIVNEVTNEVGDTNTTSGETTNTTEPPVQNTVDPDPVEPPANAESFSLSWDSSAIANGRLIVKDGTGITCVKNDSSGAEYSIKAGTTVTMQCIPAFGYQFDGNFVQEGVTATQFIPDESQECVYTFLMPSSDLVIPNYFNLAKSPKIDKSTGMIKKINGVSSSGYSSSNIASGTVLLNYSEKEPEDSIKSAIDSLASSNGIVVHDYLDITLTNQIKMCVRTKYNNKYWEKPITSLASPITLEIKVGSSIKKAAPLQVIRYHDGKAEIVASTYNEDTGIITVQADQFSYYAIAGNISNDSNSGGSTTNSTNTTKNSNTAGSSNTTNTATNSVAGTTTTATNNPKTGDEIDSYVTAFVISVIIMVAIVMSYKLDIKEK